MRVCVSASVCVCVHLWHKRTYSSGECHRQIDTPHLLPETDQRATSNPFFVQVSLIKALGNLRFFG